MSKARRILYILGGLVLLLLIGYLIFTGKRMGAYGS